ncbi:hypothetical protein CVT24_000770 [Panaeolus cyanescens]|uniref:Uncharacterized protein n=1 Tax=Panaeolus cyanescens TaxID=181874 RepID=A0A409YZ72_9AGAR|nr:hypothetical protein CVT24_000770 [Panaeolus cyanescens]
MPRMRTIVTYNDHDNTVRTMPILHMRTQCSFNPGSNYTPILPNILMPRMRSIVTYYDDDNEIGTVSILHLCTQHYTHTRSECFHHRRTDSNDYNMLASSMRAMPFTLFKYHGNELWTMPILYLRPSESKHHSGSANHHHPSSNKLSNLLLPWLWSVFICYYHGNKGWPVPNMHLHSIPNS